MEQGMFLLDTTGIVRYQAVVGPIDPMPDAGILLDLAQRLAPHELSTQGSQ